VIVSVSVAPAAILSFFCFVFCSSPDVYETHHCTFYSSLCRAAALGEQCNVDVTTADGFKLRCFAIAFTKRRQNQAKKTAYAQTGQVKNIRKKMVEIIQREVSGSDLMKVCEKFQTESIGKEIEKACQGIYPLQNVFIRKVKALRQPKLEST
jgi:ribosomal protein S3AE